MSMSDLIDRQKAIDTFHAFAPGIPWDTLDKIFAEIPSAQPEVIRCSSCKYWTQSTGKMMGYGLGRCDFHDVDLVTCNGYCYWAERKTE